MNKTLYHILLFCIFLSFFISCKKVDENIINNINSSESWVNFQGAKTTLTFTQCFDNPDDFGMQGMPASSFPSMIITLENSRPAKDTTYEVSETGSAIISIGSNYGADIWLSQSGTLNIDVDGSKIIASFTDVVFIHQDDVTTDTGSGYLVCE
jgi:hypothetical protein